MHDRQRRAPSRASIINHHMDPALQGRAGQSMIILTMRAVIYLPIYPQYLPTHIEQAPVHILICTYRHRRYHRRDVCRPSWNWDDTCPNGGIND